MRTTTLRYDLYGALVGVGLPLVGTVIEALRAYASVSPTALARAHVGQPLLWIMDTTPVVLGGLGLVILRQQRRLVRQSEEIVRLEQARRESFTRTANELFLSAKGLLGYARESTGATAVTAATVRETTQTMHQLSQTAASAALTAETVIGLALQSERASEQGRDQADASSAELLRLAEDVRGLSTQIEGLSTRMRDIFEVATVVTHVAERAEQLAREAARTADGAPGDALADQLTRLSDETRRAADEVKGILADVQRAMLAAMGAAESGGARAQAGARAVAKTGDIIHGLAAVLGESSRAARDIAQVAQQQEGAIEQVLKAMNAIAHATEETVVAADMVSREAKSLNELASSLNQAVKA